MKEKELSGWRLRIHEIIFESETFEGKLFDVVLIWMIILSVLAVVLESVPTIQSQYGGILHTTEWFFTIVFSIEYILRLLSVQKPTYYAKSFFGIIDLLAVLPTYLSIFFVGLQALLVLRIFRLLRVFRTLKMVRYVTEADVLKKALRASKAKIIVFLMTVVSIVIIMGSTMYLVEGPENGFTSIPVSMYWAVVTMTTVGYGDIAPMTGIGQFLASILMILGYGIIAVPTGIVSVELARVEKGEINNHACNNCGNTGHELHAKYCKNCGGKL